MKTKHLIPLAIVLLLSTLNPRLSTCFAQGSLTPPGAPAPTFKTLSQIEPRTPISALPFSITNGGSFYLTTNLTGVAGQDGITIAASGVTLDLMGFELAGVPGSSNGIRGSVAVVVTNVAVRNGTVRGWGGHGVSIIAQNCQLERLAVRSNGGDGIQTGSLSILSDCTASFNTGDGINADDGSTVSGCSARSNGGDGIEADSGSTVNSCTALFNTGNGISAGLGATVSGCTGFDNTGTGIVTLSGSTVTGCSARENGAGGFRIDRGTASGCTAQNNSGDGIKAGSFCTITGCTAADNGGDGIEVFEGCRVVGNTCVDNTPGAGIQVTGSDNRIDSNNVTTNDRGITIAGTGNLLIRNSASGNTPDYDIGAGNRYGPIINITAGGTAFVSGSGPAPSTLTSTDPWANFSF